MLVKIWNKIVKGEVDDGFKRVDIFIVCVEVVTEENKELTVTYYVVDWLE